MLWMVSRSLIRCFGCYAVDGLLWPVAGGVDELLWLVARLSLNLCGRLPGCRWTNVARSHRLCVVVGSLVIYGVHLLGGGWADVAVIKGSMGRLQPC